MNKPIEPKHNYGESSQWEIAYLLRWFIRLFDYWANMFYEKKDHL